MRLLVLLLLVLAIGCKGHKPQEWTLQSPDSSVTVTISQAASGEVSYSVQADSSGTPVQIVAPSALGLVCRRADFAKNLRFTGTASFKEINEPYQMISGKRKSNVNRARELQLFFTNPGADTLRIDFRAYNDGFAFRYFVSSATTDTIEVIDELSSFTISTQAKTWIQPNDTLGHWGLGYEIPYQTAIPAGTPSPRTTGWVFPALFEHPSGFWLLLSEANVTRQYSASQLEPNPVGGRYKIQLPNAFEGWYYGSRFPIAVRTMETPWRMVIVSSHLQGIVASNLVYHLSEPQKEADISWIEPGIVSWSWWSDAYSPFYFDRLRKFVDLSAQMGWKYSLVDADWDRMEGGSMEQLAQYANAKGVGLILWYNSGGENNVVRYSIELGDQFLENLKLKIYPKELLPICENHR